jgi:voltage-gated potassium channel
MTNLGKVLEQSLWKSRFVVLLAITIALILLSAFVDDGRMGLIVNEVTFACLALLSAFISAGRGKLIFIVGALVVLWFSISLMNVGAFRGALTGVTLPILILLSFIIFSVVEKTVLLASVVDLNVLCGGIACYFLISIIGALAFAELEWLHPGSIQFPRNEAAQWANIMYFSLCCLTTVGFGDVVPILPLARILATLEGAVGVIYMSVLIARLVTLYRADNRPS